MIALASGFGMGVGRFSRPLRGVGVLGMPYSALDTTRYVESLCEVLPGAGGLRLIVPSVVAVEVHIDHRCVADGVEAIG